MKILVFSDIHGNMTAFKLLEKIILSSSFDLIVNLGDIFGYFNSQEFIIERLLKIKNIINIRGNHDQNFLDCFNSYKNSNKYIEQFGTSYDIKNYKNFHLIKKFLLETLLTYQINYQGKKIFFSHGSYFNNLNGRINAMSTEIINYQDLNYNYFISGHTHVQEHFSLNNQTFLNPGSIGLPRDGYGFSYLLLDLKKDYVMHKRIRINKKDIIIELKDNCNKAKIMDVLDRGNNYE